MWPNITRSFDLIMSVPLINRCAKQGSTCTTYSYSNIVKCIWFISSCLQSKEQIYLSGEKMDETIFNSIQLFIQTIEASYFHNILEKYKLNITYFKSCHITPFTKKSYEICTAIFPNRSIMKLSPSQATLSI